VADADPSTSALELFDELVDLPREQRTRFLAARCDDATTRREIESLLAAHDDAGGFFRESTGRSRHGGDGDSDGDGEPRAPGSRIGHYELIETLGEGGFARVYRARQHHPVRREVALKLIKLGMDTRQVIARFELERQALARMDHPGIAAVYDAGVTPTGRPYFVMELVRGARINRYCEEKRLDVRQRVRLFVDVCRAVHHAHTKGILHRDLKPSNILVTEVDARPVPKVIDFGIAKATQERLTEATVVTHERQFLGTPQYMSPEQATTGGSDVDTRSDIYSLGAVLYELLTGASPLDDPATGAPSSQVEQIRRLTSDRDAPRPSTRVADPAQRRALRGELDWLIAKCLERDRARRYESAAALADDLEAYLDNRPITAAPPTLSYRARTFARRNTAGVLLSALVVFTLLAGTIVSATQAVRATRAERLAQRRLVESQAANATLSAVNDFLTGDMIGSADPAVARGPELSVRAALDKAAAAVPARFPGQPLIEAAVRGSIADAYLTLGRADLALPHAEHVLEQRRHHLGDAHPDTIAAAHACALALSALARHDEAKRLAEDALETARRTLGPDHPHTLSSLDLYASAVLAQGRWAEAEPLAREVLERSRVALGDEHPKALTWQNNYGRILRMRGRLKEAEPLFKDVWVTRTRLSGEDHPATLNALNSYALVLKQQGRLAEAEPLYKRALELRRRVVGDDHPDTLASLHNYASLLRTVGRHAEAQPLIEEGLERRRRTQGEDHPHTLVAMSACAENLRSLGRLEEALKMQEETLRRRRAALGEDHPDTLESMNNYGNGLQTVGRHSEAEPLLRQALERRRRLLGADHPHTLVSLNNYARVLADLDRHAEAEPLARQAVEGFRRVKGTDHPDTRTIVNNYATLLDALDRRDEATRLRAELAAVRPESPATVPSSQPDDSP
jgi:serine/threonine protein kinase/Tfp pilus assembly protein PilF